MTGLMRAIVIDDFGGPDALHMAEIERPLPGPGEVLIEIAYAAANPADWKAREGWLSRYFDYRFPFVLGFDAAGRIAALGEGVEGLSVGDRVVAASNQGMGLNGSYAEFTLAAAERCIPLPASLSMARAAALPTAGMTALEALVDVGNIAPDQYVLVNGGAGGTGGFAVALAARAGARVIATCSAHNADYVRALGAERIIDYRHENVGVAVHSWAPGGLDLVVDAVGQGSILGAIDWVRPGGTIAAIGTLIADETPHDADLAAARGVRVVPTVSSFANQGHQLRALVAALAEGAFDAVQIEIMPLAEIAEAHRRIEAGHVRGKLVLEINAALD
jgi:NADPH:quinone reductase-like Zn-dependent oxidoreductase